MKHKVSELTGALLDAAVAAVEGRRYDVHRMAPHGVDFLTVVDPEQSGWVAWSPSRTWADGGPIIERERITVAATSDPALWYAELGDTGMRGFGHALHAAGGPTPLIAAMRAYVASRSGDEVDLPD